VAEVGFGGAGGNGGSGGAASLQWLSGTVQTTGIGLQATADGGIGGNGGTAGNPNFGPLDARGGDAGVGGNGGTASVVLSGGTITINRSWTKPNSTGPCRCKWRRLAVLAG
jgi:hypothetical protein